MRILFITEHFYPHIGGSEKLLLDLAVSLVKNNQEVRVVTSNSGGINGTHKYNDIKIYSCKWPSLFGHPIPNKKDINNHIKWADIVQTAQYTAAPKALMVAKRFNKPCVLMAYEYLGNSWSIVDNPFRATIFKLFEKWVFNKPYDQFIAISKATRKDLISAHINPTRIKVIYPVFNNFSYWKNKNKSRHNSMKNFIYYGRPGKTKGVFILLDAIRQLDESLSEEIVFTFILSNDPITERDRFNELVKQYKLDKRIVILESQEQDKLKSLIIESYCVIVPSFTEGFGYSAYQACMLGKKIIVSDAGSLPEVISGKCLIFKSGDSKSLALAINKAINNKFTLYTDRIGGDNTHKIIELYTKLIK